MREIVHIQAGQCGNQIGAKVSIHGEIKCTIKSAKIQKLIDQFVVVFSILK